MTEQAQISETDTTMSTGARLKIARQSKGLECEDIARDLKLDLKLIEALEADDVDKLPQPVYTAGYIRNYARVVELPADSLVEAYVAQETKDLPSLPTTRVDSLPDRYRQVAEALPRSFSIAAANARNATPVQYVAIGIGVLFAVLIGWQSSVLMNDDDTELSQIDANDKLIITKQTTNASAVGNKPISLATDQPNSQIPSTQVEQHKPNESIAIESQSKPTPDTRKLVKKEKSESLAEQAKMAEKVAISLNNNPDQQMPSSTSQSSLKKESQQGVLDDNVTYIEKQLKLKDLPGESGSGDALTLLQLQNATDLTLTFTRNSWVDIRDATGKRLIRKLGIAGNSQKIKGVAPFQVLLGYGHGVTIEYNGKAVDFSAFQGNTVARFTLEVPREKELQDSTNIN